MKHFSNFNILSEILQVLCFINWKKINADMKHNFFVSEKKRMLRANENSNPVEKELEIRKQYQIRFLSKGTLGKRMEKSGVRLKDKRSFLKRLFIRR